MTRSNAPIPVDSNNDPIPLSFLPIFFGGGPRLGSPDAGRLAIVKKKGKGVYAVGRSREDDIMRVRTSKKVPKSEPSDAVPPEPLTAANLEKATVEAAAPATAVVDPPPPDLAPAPAPKPPSVKSKPPTPAPSPKPPMATPQASSEFTALEDSAILGMRVRGFTWAEMEKIMPEKKKGAIQKRCVEMGDVLGGSGDGGDGGGGDAGGNPGKGGVKLQKKGKGKGKDGGPAPKGVLKHKAQTVDEDSDEGIDIKGRPMVLVDGEDKLSPEDYVKLTEIVRKEDESKWLAVASRWFDRTGTKVEPSKLRHSLKNVKGV